LCLVGDGDRLTPPKYSTYLAQHIPGARVEVIAGAGHMVFLEQPGPFNRAVMEFMAEL
jgi:pimeloyl-ACP methyl ester carboxylesterase